MKTFIFLTVVIFLTVTVFSKSEDFWKKSNGIVSPSSVDGICVTQDDVIYASSIRKLFRSTDLGNSWKTITLEDAQFIDNAYPIGKIECNKDGDLFILTDKAFFKLKNGQDTAKIIFYLNKMYHNEYSISLSKDSKKVVVLAGDEIWVSNNSGNSWEQIMLNEFQHVGLYLRSLCYDENFGIIINFGTEATEVDEKFVYHSLDDGKTWYQLKTIPGTDKPIDHVFVGNENLWIVGTYSYNFTTKELNPVGTDLINSIYSTDIGYFATDYSSFYFSEDDGESWIKNDKSSFFGVGLMWLDGFYATKSGKIFIGTRYKKFKYSTDKGVNWIDIKLTNDEEMQFGSIKYIGGKLYATDNTHNYFVSDDNGKSWTGYPLTKVNYYTNVFDVNKNGDMVYDDGTTIYYSPDHGSSWVTLDTTGFNRVPRKMLRIFDNGKIICQDEHTIPFVYDDPYKPGKYIRDVFINNLFLLENGNYLDFSGGYFKLLDEDFKEIGNINYSINSILGYNPSYNNFAFSNDGSFYVSTNRGIFKSNSVSDNFKLLAYKDTTINHIFIDDNNVLYINIGQRILISKDDGISWHEIVSNLSTSNIEKFLAFGDSKLIAKSDKVYYADLKEFPAKTFLTLKSNPKESSYYYNEPIELQYEVRNNLGNAVESAEIFILNSLTNKIDTLITDENGKANYVKIISNYNQNIERNLVLTSFAQKLNNYKSATISTSFTYFANQKEFKCISDSSIIATKPGNDVSIRLSLIEYINNKFESSKGSLQINDSFSDIDTTLIYDAAEFINYQINVPDDAVYGIYEIRVRGINLNNQFTNDLVLNLLVVDSIPKGILVSNIIEDFGQEQMLIYPNPTSDYITIQLQTSEVLKTSDVLQVQIFDMLGLEILSESMRPITSSHRINVEKLPAGVYFIRFGDKVEKFVKI